MYLHNQRWHNSTKEIVVSLREILPPDVFVGIQVPSSRKKKMVIVVDAGGGNAGPFLRSQRINLMIWFDNSWENTGDWAYEVDSLMRSLDARPFSNIVSIDTAVFPVPSGDGESSTTPVFSAGYDLLISSQDKITNKIRK